MKYLKSEKGSITVFVIASCLLFVVTVVGVATYIQNKVNIQNEEYIRIKTGYEKDIDKEAEIYNNIISSGMYNKLINVNFEEKPGIYIMPQNASRVNISQRFNIINNSSEFINNIQYAWTNTESQSVDEDLWSDLSKNTTEDVIQKNDATQGTYYLNIRINKDKVTTSKPITVENPTISINSSTITFSEGLNFNYKVGIGTSIEDAKSNVQTYYSQEKGTLDISSLTIISGDYIYIEATDSYGNKYSYSEQK